MTTKWTLLPAGGAVTGAEILAAVQGGSSVRLTADALLTNAVRVTGTQTVAGVKTFTSSPVVPDNSFAVAKTLGLQAALDAETAAAAAALARANHTGVQAISTVTGLQTALDGKRAGNGRLSTLPFGTLATGFVAGTANDALLVKVTPDQAVAITKLIWFTGSATSGNYDIGIYNAAGTKLWSKGSTAWPGSNARTSVTITSQSLVAGADYWVAIAADNVTGTVRGVSLGFVEEAWNTAGTGLALRYATSFPLPSSFVIGTPTAVSLLVPSIVLAS